MQCPIDINGVVKVFKALSDLEVLDGRAASVCKSAAVTIARVVKPECDLAAEMPRICYAAACLAYYRYELVDEMGGVQSFKAGDVTINSAGSAAGARVLYEQALADIGDLLIDRKFAFRRV